MRHPSNVRAAVRLSLGMSLLFAGTALLAGPASGQDGDAREVRRILHLRSGQTVRAVTRCTGDRWEYRGDPRTSRGESIVRETIGGRTAAWVPTRQR